MTRCALRPEDFHPGQHLVLQGLGRASTDRYVALVAAGLLLPIQWMFMGISCGDSELRVSTGVGGSAQFSLATFLWHVHVGIRISIYLHVRDVMPSRLVRFGAASPVFPPAFGRARLEAVSRIGGAAFRY